MQQHISAGAQQQCSVCLRAHVCACVCVVCVMCDECWRALAGGISPPTRGHGPTSGGACSSGEPSVCVQPAVRLDARNESNIQHGGGRGPNPYLQFFLCLARVGLVSVQ